MEQINAFLHIVWTVVVYALTSLWVGITWTLFAPTGAESEVSSERQEE